MNKYASQPVEGERLANDELAELYRRYGFLLQRRCRALLREDAAAADALQDAFLKFIQAGDALREADNSLAWMYRVVDRCCFDQMRRRKIRRTEPIEDHDATLGVHPNVDIEARNAVFRVLHTLSEAEYEVAVLAYIEGVNQVDIATRLGVSRPTIWKRLAAVREHASRILGGAA